MTTTRTAAASGGRAASLLELHLALLLFALPLPFGAVGPGGRLLLELGAVSLLALWLIQAVTTGVRLPSKAALGGAIGLLGFTLLQALPVPASFVALLNPQVERIRSAAEPPASILEVEQRVLGHDPRADALRPTLSLDPQATSSALRTGAALVVLMLVSASVAASRGVERLALALLVSGAFQGLYGLLVLASGYDRIWHVPKKYALDSATGTFVNANHFASYMALVLSCAAALVLRNARNTFLAGEGSRRWRSLGGDGSRDLILALLLVCGFAGLLASNSRAGIAVGLFALGATVVGARGIRTRVGLALLALVALVAAIPLARLEPQRLVQSYLASGDELADESGRVRVWRDTLELAAAFPLTGSGFGTFAATYPLFRSREVRQFYQHAHDDALQVAAEGGLVGLALLVLLCVPVTRGIVRGLAGRHGLLAPGLAAGLAAVSLHSFLDFPFHLPAIAATAAVVAGALLVEPWAETTSA